MNESRQGHVVSMDESRQGRVGGYVGQLGVEVQLVVDLTCLLILERHSSRRFTKLQDICPPENSAAHHPVGFHGDFAGVAFWFEELFKVRESVDFLQDDDVPGILLKLLLDQRKPIFPDTELFVDSLKRVICKLVAKDIPAQHLNIKTNLCPIKSFTRLPVPLNQSWNQVRI